MIITAKYVFEAPHYFALYQNNNQNTGELTSYMYFFLTYFNIISSNLLGRIKKLNGPQLDYAFSKNKTKTYNQTNNEAGR